MNFLAIFLALAPKFKIHFRQLLHSTQDFEILDHGSKCLPLDEKWWDLRIFCLASITESLISIDIFRRKQKLFSAHKVRSKDDGHLGPYSPFLVGCQV